MTFDERIVAISTARKRVRAIISERTKLIEAWDRALVALGVDTTSERLGRPFGVPSQIGVSKYDLNAMAAEIGKTNVELTAAQNEWRKLEGDYVEAKKKIGAI